MRHLRPLALLLCLSLLAPPALALLGLLPCAMAADATAAGAPGERDEAPCAGHEDPAPAPPDRDANRCCDGCSLVCAAPATLPVAAAATPAWLAPASGPPAAVTAVVAGAGVPPLRPPIAAPA